MTPPPPPSPPPPPPPPSCEPEEGYTDWRTVAPFPPGYRRHPIRFIPASTSTSPTPQPQRSGKDISSLYLSLVGLSPIPSPAPPETPLCPSCNLPQTPGHDTTLAHLSQQPHSFPPHHLPRDNIGLRILQDSGWDPDSRLGLGPNGEGPRYPIKVIEKTDRRGVGKKPVQGGKVEKKERLGAKGVRKREEEAKGRRARIMGELAGAVEWDVLVGGRKEEEGLR